MVEAGKQEMDPARVVVRLKTRKHSVIVTIHGESVSHAELEAALAAAAERAGPGAIVVGPHPLDKGETPLLYSRIYFEGQPPDGALATVAGELRERLARDSRRVRVLASAKL